MRDLSSSDRNELEIFDGRTNTEMRLYYRTPTPKESVLYQKGMIEKKGRKVVLKLHKTRVDFGLRVITGFQEGDFGVDGKPISWNPNSPHYREDWKALLKQYAPDIISTMAVVIFEGAKPENGLDEIEGYDSEDADNEEVVLEEAAPLETSSGAS